MEREYENRFLRYRTVVCGLGSPGKVDRQVFGSFEKGNEHLSVVIPLCLFLTI